MFALGFAYMTKALMNLANGKIVLVLEGGYELNGMAECGTLCIEALLHRPVNFQYYNVQNFYYLILFRYQCLVKKFLKLNLMPMEYVL